MLFAIGNVRLYCIRLLTESVSVAGSGLGSRSENICVAIIRKYFQVRKYLYRLVNWPQPRPEWRSWQLSRRQLVAEPEPVAAVDM